MAIHHRNRIHISIGDVVIDLEGSTIQVDEEFDLLKGDDSWSHLIEKLRDARELAVEAAVRAVKDVGLPERGSAFLALVKKSALQRKPDQVLGAIHYLREVEGKSDCPPRVIEDLFEDAGLEKPGNLSLYLNRLREKEYLCIPDGVEDKNRYAILTPEGRAHLDKRSLE
ncbi:MAG: hypothetical protein O2866_04375 [archaeon]|nr:hypothetical protein [archaeon]MDA1168101.1 hypothetical protein [archaeon]